jgi:hypothetical protein
LSKLLLQLVKKERKVEDFDKGDTCFLCCLSTQEVTFAQLKLVSEGVSMSQLQEMWRRNGHKLPDISSKLRRQLPDNHILCTTITEHEMLCCFMADLVDANNEVQLLKTANSSTSEIRRLAHIASHLASAEQHREREEQVIYPEIAKKGYSGLLKIIDSQHLKINNLHFDLNDLVWKIEKIDFDEFKEKLNRIATSLAPAMRLHIFIENNIVLPLALEVIPDPKEWKRMKLVCDDIGYCGYDS